MKVEALEVDDGGSGRIKPDGLGLAVATMFLAGTMAGSGVLTLPRAMVETGPVEIFMIVFFAINAAFVGTRLGNCWVILEERYPEFREHVRDPYPSIAEKAAGQIGRKLSVACINFTLYGGGCVFIVLMSAFIKNLLGGLGVEISLCMWMVIVSLSMVPPCWLGTPNDFWPLAVGALTTTLAACLMVMVKLSMDVADPSSCFPALQLNSNDSTTFTGIVPNFPAPSFLGFFKAFSSTMFAFAGAPNFPTIQSDMRDRKQFTKAAIIAMSILLLTYAPMAGVGYAMLGDLAQNNIVQNMCDGPVKVCVEILLLLHLVSAFPIVVNPSNQFFEGLIGIPKHFTWKRCVFRTFVILCLLFISESIPDFGSILDLVGGSTVTLLTFVFPPFFYMRLVDMSGDNSNWKQRRISMYERVYCWFVIIIGTLGGVCSTVVAILGIVDTHFTLPCYIQDYAPDIHSLKH